MRKLLLATPLLVSVVSLGCDSKPPIGPGVVKITETTTTIATTTTTTIPIPTVSLFQFSPQTPEVLQIIFFDGTLSTPGTGRTIVAYDWDWGDGASKTGARATHDYKITGVYLVTLRVTDDAGQVARSSQPVTVRPVIPPVIP